MVKNMLRNKANKVIFCITAGMAAAFLTGCIHTAHLKSEAVAPEIAKNSDRKKQGGENRDGESGQRQQSAGEATPGPVAAVPSDGETIEWAICSEGFYCYSNGSSYGYLSENGEAITPCIYSEASPFSEGTACVCLDGKYGYIGKAGETVLPFVYDQASPFMEGAAYVSQDGVYGLIDRTGNMIAELTDCESVSSFREGLSYFSRDGRYGYMDRTGKTVIDPVYDDAGYFEHGLAIVRRGGLFGVIGKDGREIVPPAYNSIQLEESHIIAQRDDRFDCFDRAGNEIFSGGWDRIWECGDLFCIWQDNGKRGLVDKNGQTVLEPVYSHVTPIPDKGLAIVKDENNRYGVLDLTGQVKVPFRYSEIRYVDMGDGLCVTDAETGNVGFLDAADLSVSIPVVYDSLSEFTGERAVAELDGKYGVIRYDGTPEISVMYDRIRLFSDGSMAVWTGDTAELYNSQGERIHSGEYLNIRELGDGYEAESARGKRILDREGAQVVSGYRWSDSVYGAECTYLLDNGMLVRTGYEGGRRPEEALLTNQITPQAGAFAEFLQNGTITVPDGSSGNTQDLAAMRQYRKQSRLYRIGGEQILYFYAEPWRRLNFPESYSGLFIVRNGQAEQLITGFECGGSLRGDYVCFWYDTQTSTWKVGTEGNWGGFDGSAFGGAVYELEDGRAVCENTFLGIRQSASTYGEAELLQNAALFYDENDIPFTEETIREAEYVLEYSVNDARTSAEQYHAVTERYKYVPVLSGLYGWRVW